MRLLRTLAALALLAVASNAAAQESAFLVTYDHHLAEKGEWEIEQSSVLGPADGKGGHRFLGSSLELEHGVQSWWTTELYLDGQSTEHESTLFTGERWENRFRPSLREHVVNPVLYVELEHITGADKSLREVVGHDGAADQAEPNALANDETEREVEAKLILSSTRGRWSFAENLIAEKNLDGGPWEYGHSFGVSRTVSDGDPDEDGDVEAAKLAVGLELYGGLGTNDGLGLHDTSHYLAPTVEVGARNGFTAKVSPGWGLSDASHPFLLRFSFGWEIEAKGEKRRAEARQRNLAPAKR